MKYRNYEIIVNQRDCVSEYPILEYSISKENNGWEIYGGFDEDYDGSIRDKVNELKLYIDEHISIEG